MSVSLENSEPASRRVTTDYFRNRKPWLLAVVVGSSWQRPTGRFTSLEASFHFRDNTPMDNTAAHDPTPPSLEEIQERALEIQSEWSDYERELRRIGYQTERQRTQAVAILKAGQWNPPRVRSRRG